MDINYLEIIGGYGRQGAEEPVRKVSLKMGDIVSIVGPTGSGKTELINDVERFADDNTPSRRRLLIDGKSVPEESVGGPVEKPHSADNAAHKFPFGSPSAGVP